MESFFLLESFGVRLLKGRRIGKCEGKIQDIVFNLIKKMLLAKHK